MRLGSGVFVDARTRYDVLARYINDCRGPSAIQSSDDPPRRPTSRPGRDDPPRRPTSRPGRDKRCHNVAFDKRPDERRARVVAARPVFAGDELYASYGPLYWLGADMQGEASARLPEDAVVALLERERVFWDG